MGITIGGVWIKLNGVNSDKTQLQSYIFIPQFHTYTSHRTEHGLNRSHFLFSLKGLPKASTGSSSSRGEALPGSINVKACMLSGVPSEERLYSAASGAVSRSGVPSMSNVVSSVFCHAPCLGIVALMFCRIDFAHRYVYGCMAQPIEQGICAVALGRFGEGFVGFLGDVNHEEDTWAVASETIRRLSIAAASKSQRGSSGAEKARGPTAAASAPGSSGSRQGRTSPGPPAPTAPVTGGPAGTGPSVWARGLSQGKQYEWLVDCYRMRVDDDYALGGGNLHGLYNQPASAVSADYYLGCYLSSYLDSYLSSLTSSTAGYGF